MRWRAVGARRLVILGLAAGACSLSDEPADTVCGTGTVLKDNQCVADDGEGGDASCTGRDCANDGGAGGNDPSMGGATPRAGTANGGTPNPGHAGSANAGSANAGSASSANAGSGGSTNPSGDGGMSNGGVPEPSAGAGGVETAGGSSDGGMSNAGAGGSDDTPHVVKTSGCGKAFTGTSGAKVTIQTSGVKAANCAARLNGVPKCGPWSTPRDYYVFLPANYDPNHPYTLVFQGPGCGGTGAQVYALDNNMNDTIIRVGLTPGPNSLGHGTNENQGCFDDKEGDDSIDFPFYENVVDKLSDQLCFDKTRVFASGNSTGGSLANELGCKYAGDPLRPIRAVLVNTGGLFTEPQFMPTCTDQPMAGMWVHEINDTTNPFIGNKLAITRAMQVNSCTIGTSYDTAQFENFAIGGGNAADACKKIKGCPAAYPLVVCPLPGNGHGSHDSVTNPGFSAFVSALNP